jgi:predicted molibdopterin-dependent oxidoreductase YjgC
MFSRGKGRFAAIEYRPPQELPDSNYPLMLTTGRILFHFHTGSMTRRSKGLSEISKEELAEISPKDAQALGIKDGDSIQIASRRGKIKAKARVTDSAQPGVVFMTFHFAETATNLLTNPALDPISKIPELKVCAVKVEKASA